MKKSEIQQLEKQGCFSDDWSLVEISEKTDLGGIRNVWFRGRVSVGAGTRIINVPGGLSNVRIGKNVRIENVGRIENSPQAVFGIGTDVAVLDETGSRSVRIYPGLSSQVAVLAARKPDYRAKLIRMIDRHISEIEFDFEIGDGAELKDCGPILDVRVWPGVKIEGASFLSNGSIVSNSAEAETLAYVGNGVNAENFIIEDGIVANGVLLRNSYVGQGARLDKGFTAHDSLFFANCAMECGEACAVLAGPYSVSMHKSTLLIGCQTSFFNAGSGTNMSNHRYKTGPEHWGVLERGVKTSSNAYLMHGARIGAYSLLMGEHKLHPYSYELPFSYLFGNGNGETSILPGAMLKSFGLKRDGEKWPRRDARKGALTRLNDRISFDILNPLTIGQIKSALELPKHTACGDNSGLGWQLSDSAKRKGEDLYRMALCKYLHSKGETHVDSPSASVDERISDWKDVGAQLLPAYRLEEAMTKESLRELERSLTEAFAAYESDEAQWARQLKESLLLSEEEIRTCAAKFDLLSEKDLKRSIDALKNEQTSLGL